MIFLCQANGDFAINENQFSLTDDAVGPFTPQVGQETLQLVRARLKTFLGEEALNASLGVPYIETIFRKTTPLETVQALLYNVIKTTPGVLQVLEFDISVNAATRQGSVSFTAQVEGGAVTSTETFP